MTAEQGRKLVLKVGDGATAEVFATVGGMLSTAISINGEAVDITDKDSAGRRELLADAGVQSFSVTANGVFKDTASETTIRENAQNQTIDNYEIVFESGEKYSGAFQIITYETTGDHNNARQFSLTLESSGVITYA